MIQQVKALSAKFDDLSLIPRAYIVDKNQLLQVVSWLQTKNMISLYNGNIFPFKSKVLIHLAQTQKLLFFT